MKKPYILKKIKNKNGETVNEILEKRIDEIFYNTFIEKKKEYKDNEDGCIYKKPTETELSNYNQQKTQEENNILLQQKKEYLINKRKTYLNNTDWYIIREYETKDHESFKAIPSEIEQKRALSRKEINDIELLNTISELEQFE